VLLGISLPAGPLPSTWASEMAINTLYKKMCFMVQIWWIGSDLIVQLNMPQVSWYFLEDHFFARHLEPLAS